MTDEALYRLLAALYPPGTARELCDGLKVRFGNVQNALEREADELDLPGSDPLTVSLIPALARYMQREEFLRGGVLCTADDLRTLLGSIFPGSHVESCHLICLKKDGTFLRAVHLCTGTIDQAPFYMRTAAQAAVESGAECFLLTHNHPGGSAAASRADTETTAAFLRFLGALGAVLIDHVIYLHNGLFSMRAAASVPEAEWKRHAPLPPHFSDWTASFREPATPRKSQNE